MLQLAASLEFAEQIANYFDEDDNVQFDLRLPVLTSNLVCWAKCAIDHMAAKVPLKIKLGNTLECLITHGTMPCQQDEISTRPDYFPNGAIQITYQKSLPTNRNLTILLPMRISVQRVAARTAKLIMMVLLLDGSEHAQEEEHEQQTEEDHAPAAWTARSVPPA